MPPRAPRSGPRSSCSTMARGTQCVSVVPVEPRPQSQPRERTRVSASAATKQLPANGPNGHGGWTASEGKPGVSLTAAAVEMNVARWKGRLCLPSPPSLQPGPFCIQSPPAGRLLRTPQFREVSQETGWTLGPVHLCAVPRLILVGGPLLPVRTHTGLTGPLCHVLPQACPQQQPSPPSSMGLSTFTILSPL